VFETDERMCMRQHVVRHSQLLCMATDLRQMQAGMIGGRETVSASSYGTEPSRSDACVGECVEAAGLAGTGDEQARMQKRVRKNGSGENKRRRKGKAVETVSGEACIE
jgi:hypothetical protein